MFRTPIDRAQQIYDEYLVKDGGSPAGVVVAVEQPEPLVVVIITTDGRRTTVNGGFAYDIMHGA